jgi:hypothetical protein
MPRRSTFKKQKVDCFHEAILIEDDALWDTDIQEVRTAAWLKELEAEQNRLCQERIERYYLYFHTHDSTCREHDRRHCAQCTRYADGRGHPLEYL